MGGVIGLDVGGANTKAVWRDGDARRTVSRPFEVWRDRETLTAVLRDVVAEAAAGAPVGLVALTTTAELSDAFRTKREGVAFVLDAVEAALPGPTLVFTTAGDLVSVAEARERPLEVAAANWVASALAVGAVHPDALMLDVGSTTADVIPIAGGARRRRGPHGPRPPARRRAPLHRRAAHEPRDDRAARPGARAAGARSPPSCSRSPPTSTCPRATSRPRPTRARRPTDARRPSPAPASASPGSSAPTPTSSRPPRSTRSPPSSTPSRSRQIEAAARQVATRVADATRRS